MPMKTLAFFAALAAVAPTFAAEVVRDDFSNPKSGWQNKAATTDRDLGFAVYTDTGKYQMTPVHDNAFGFIAAPRQAEGGNVRIESDLFLYAGIGAGAGGVACRFQDHQNFYAFLVRGDAATLIVKIRNGKATPLAQGKVRTVMAGAADTRLTAECIGDTLRLKAKDGNTIEVRDGELTSGRSGLLVIGEKMAGTSAAFDNFVLSTP